jgi:hypothetical protein
MRVWRNQLVALLQMVPLAASSSCGITSSSCFVGPRNKPTPPQQRQKLSGATLFVLDRKHAPLRPKESRLFLQVNNNTIGKEESRSKSIFQDYTNIEEPGLLIADLFAIAIASQLMGLLDVVNDPIFYLKGGWTQPLPVVPSTLDVLVGRFSLLSVIWILVGIFRKDAFVAKSVETDKMAIQKALRILVDFSLIRVAFAVAIGCANNYGGDIGIEIATALRQCYFVGLGIPAMRFLYSQCYFR